MNTTNVLYFSIAEYLIRLDISFLNTPLLISPYWKNFTTQNSKPVDLTIKCFSGLPEITLNEESCLFDAAKKEKINVENNWGIYRLNNYIYISAVTSQCNKLILQIISETEMHLYFERESSLADPFLPPMGPLIYYYLSSFNKSFLIHASGVQYENSGYIFTGISGIGKSTMAKIWKENGANVIHDDRLLLREVNEQFYFYNTPLYDDDFSKSAVVNAVFILSQSKTNTIKKINGAMAASKILANCIQHPYDDKLVSSLLDCVSKLLLSVPVYELGFYPDSNIIDFIKTHTE